MTVWVGETEKMFHTKGMAGFTLYPDRAYLEIHGQVYNPTDRPQTFLWWANPAVPVNDATQSIFPPDVHAVMDHGKRAVSKFPIADGVYYKYDYAPGTDISRYKTSLCRPPIWHITRTIILSAITTTTARRGFCISRITMFPPAKAVDLGLRGLWQGVGSQSDR